MSEDKDKTTNQIVKPLTCTDIALGRKIFQRQVQRDWFGCPVCGRGITTKVYKSLNDHMNDHGITTETIWLDSQVTCDNCGFIAAVQITDVQFELALVGIGGG
jgi:predicted RNA-binding Zn-ribbon protein involved in translation (DUF1610 family)